MKCFRLFFTILVLLSGSVCFGQERLLLSALTTNKKLVLIKIEYANKKYTVVDSAVFSIPIQGGLTAMAPLPNGRVQVLWTAGTTAQGMNAQSPNLTFKINSMTADSDLNKVGNNRKLPPTLTSLYNMDMYKDYDGYIGRKFAFESGNNVVSLNRNVTTGNLFGPRDTLFMVPGSADQIDTNLYGDNYSGLRFDGRFHFVCGNINNAAPTVVVPFVGDVISSTMLPKPGSTNFNFTLMKRTSNPERIAIENFQINGETCQPLTNPVRHFPPVAQNLGSLPFFNGITSVASETSPNGGHVFFIRSSSDGIDIMAYHMNTNTGKKDSPPTKIPRVVTPEDRFIYALFGMAVPTT